MINISLSGLRFYFEYPVIGFISAVLIYIVRKILDEFYHLKDPVEERSEIVTRFVTKDCKIPEIQIYLPQGVIKVPSDSGIILLLNVCMATSFQITHFTHNL